MISSDTSNSSDEEKESMQCIKEKKRSANSNYSYNNRSDEPSSKRIYLDSKYGNGCYNTSACTTNKDSDLIDINNIPNVYDKNDFPNKSDDSESLDHVDENCSDFHPSISEQEKMSENYSKISSTNVLAINKKDQPLPGFSSAANLMMKKMGYEKGKGLGKNLQGRAEPVSTSTQKGRRGLGLEFKELDKAYAEYNPEDELIKVEDEILWLEETVKPLSKISDVELEEWTNKRKIGRRQNTIDNETHFCNEILVKNLIKSKSVFDKLEKSEMREARTRSNPFETIRGSIFLNRAAVKMANIDSVCNFMFSNPSNLSNNELLYFADVCAGPGGFSEYILWKKKWRAKGFGFTLKNENDFKLDDFYAGPCETFHPFYGPKENGDVYDPENQQAFKDLIMLQTEKKGVHFMMADGGFAVKGKETIQEILSKQLYLCQCLTALMIVRTHGHFVTKLFDLFTPFSAGLVYIIYRCFRRVSIFKPNTSRPANSERYLICEGKLDNIDNVVDYLSEINNLLLRNDKINDILEIVPLDKLMQDVDFLNYLKQSNEKICVNQIVALKKIAAYTQNKNMIETKQNEIREQCLKQWGLPDQVRVAPSSVKPTVKVQSLLQNSISVLQKNDYKDKTKLSEENILKTVLLNEYDWYCMPCSSGERDAKSEIVDRETTFYLGMGRSQVYKYCNKNTWELVRGLELPRDTLIYAEMVMELRKEGKAQTKTFALHILDAFYLGGENISEQYICERLDLIQLFCKALWKPTDRSFYPVRVKKLFEINADLQEKLQLVPKTMKNGLKVKGYIPVNQAYENDGTEPYYYVPSSLVFFKYTQEPWNRCYSKKTIKIYFFNTKTNESIWENVSKEKERFFRASFSKAIETRVIWNWPSDPSLTMDDFKSFISKKYKK